jgi:hypothetical protein
MAASSAPAAFAFPHANLPSFHGTRPNYSLLKPFHAALNANAISVPSDGGNGALGHLALVVPAARYNALSGDVAFLPPVNPGAAPVHPDGSTAAQITEVNRAHLANLAVYRTYLNVEAALKQQVLTAVPHKYIQLLADEETGFATISTLAILNHLDATYGQITNTEISANLKDLDRAWDPASDIETLWTHVRTCRAFATAAADPISEQTAIRSVVANLEGTGLFTADIRDWNKLPAAAHTLAALMDHFNSADADRRRLLTVHAAGFHGNALLAAVPAPLPPVPVEQALVAPTVPAPTANPTVTTAKPFYYCWSHGLGPNRSHTSGTCRFPLAGHCRDATLENMKGGCDRIHRRKGDTAVWVAPTNPPAGTRNVAAAAPTES